MKTPIRICSITALAAIFAACSISPVTILKRKPRRPMDYPIFLTEGDVEDPYEVVATVKSPAYEDHESRERGEEFLRDWARRVGGDWVIHVRREPIVKERAGYHPTGTFRTGTHLVTHYFYTGTIVCRDNTRMPNRDYH